MEGGTVALVGASRVILLLLFLPGQLAREMRQRAAWRQECGLRFERQKERKRQESRQEKAGYWRGGRKIREWGLSQSRPPKAQEWKGVGLIEETPGLAPLPTVWS